MSERIAKVMARAGLCSRREAERWIEAGRVQVNGTAIVSAALNISEDDQVVVDGKPLPTKQASTLWLYHKPVGLVTSHDDPQSRPTVFENLPSNLPRVISVGRLDLNSEGLLLLTNDGELSRQLELPSSEWNRIYRVRVFGEVDAAALAALTIGVTVEGVDYQSIEASIERASEGKNTWLRFALKEGKNREIRKVCGHLGLRVNRLIRVSYGPFELGDLAPGQVQEVPQSALDALMKG